MSTQRVAALAGAAHLQTGSRQLRIAGIEQGVARPVHITIGGCEATDLPAALNDLVISSVTNTTPGRWQLQAGTRSIEVSGRSVHVQRPVGDPFYRAVPGAPLTWQARAGWALLLNVLRVPGMARLFQWLRSR
jgi:hypothetical protein